MTCRALREAQAQQRAASNDERPGGHRPPLQLKTYDRRAHVRWLGGIRPRNDNVFSGKNDFRKAARTHASHLRHIDWSCRNTIYVEAAEVKPWSLPGPFDPTDSCIAGRKTENFRSSGGIAAVDADFLAERFP